MHYNNYCCCSPCTRSGIVYIIEAANVMIEFGRNKYCGAMLYEAKISIVIQYTLFKVQNKWKGIGVSI